MNTETVLWLTGTLMEACLVCLVYFRRMWRVLPVFVAYCTWDLISNCLVYAAYTRLTPSAYRTVYIIQVVLDSMLVFCVLIELVRSILQPISTSLSKRFLAGFGVLVVFGIAIVWQFAVVPTAGDLPANFYWLLRLQQTTSIVRILFFIALAASSKFFSIGFRDRELQVATGFGFYAFVSLVVGAAIRHATKVSTFRTLNEVLVSCYLLSLLYWMVCFARKETPRRQMTPESQSLLLALAGSAHARRNQLQSPDTRKRLD